MNKIILLAGVCTVLGLVLLVSFGNTTTKTERTQEDADPVAVTVEHEAYGLSFTHEDAYVAITAQDAVSGDLVFAQNIFDAEEYRELEESTVAREAPPSLVIEIFRNPMNLDAKEWILQTDRSNYAQSQDAPLPVTIGNAEFLTYTYDGLYRTDAYVHSKDGYIYVFSNMWSDAESPMKKDMEELLATIVWSTPTVPAQVAHGDITVSDPEIGGSVTSPLVVEGMARGTWFFEASFPLVLVNWDGLIIAEGYAQAEREWMTEEFVPFKGELIFTKPEFNERGTLILKKDNPSGLPQNDDAIEIPIIFK